MYPQSHFLFSYMISLIFVRLGYFNHYHALIVAILAVLIDIDHYFSYIKATKNYNLRNAFNGCTKKHKSYGKTKFHFLPGIVLITTIVVVLWLINFKLYSVIIGLAYYSHIVLDHIHLKFIEHLDRKIKYSLFGFHIWCSYPEVIFDCLNILLILILLFL